MALGIVLDRNMHRGSLLQGPKLFLPCASRLTSVSDSVTTKHEPSPKTNSLVPDQAMAYRGPGKVAE